MDTTDVSFDVLGDETRRRVVELLAAVGPQRAGKLAEAMGTSPATMSRHLRILLDSGLVEDERIPTDARVRMFRLRPEPFRDLQAWLDQVQAHWTEQLGSFKAHAEARRR